MIVLGDHQPATLVSGAGANHQVPITIIAHDPTVLTPNTAGRPEARPRGFSKYVAAASCVDPDLPDNDIRALRGHLLHATHTPA